MGRLMIELEEKYTDFEKQLDTLIVNNDTNYNL